MKNKLNYILENLERLDEFQIQYIESMVEKYPYHQNWRNLLTLKLLKLGNNQDMFPFYKAGMYSIDKNKLFHLLNNQNEDHIISLTKDIQSEKSSMLLKENETFIVEQLNEGESLNSIDEIAIEKQWSEQIKSDEVLVPIPLLDKSKLELDSPKKKKKDNKKYNTKTEIKKEKKSKKNSKKNKIQVLYFDDKESIQQLEKSLQSGGEISSLTPNTIKKNKFKEKALKSKSVKIDAEISNTKTIPSNLVFTEWLKSLTPVQETSFSKNIKKDKKKPKIIKKSKKHSDNKKKQKNTDKSKNNKEIISETLANILVKQGHLDMAEKMYNKLSLKYPEKSTYFAAQITKIQESNNN